MFARVIKIMFKITMECTISVFGEINSMHYGVFFVAFVGFFFTIDFARLWGGDSLESYKIQSFPRQRTRSEQYCFFSTKGL